MKTLRFKYHGHLPILSKDLRVLKLWNPFVCSVLTFRPLRHSLLEGGGEGISLQNRLNHLLMDQPIGSQDLA